MERIRTAAVAGSFYPASSERLRKTVETLLAQAQPKTLEGKLRGLIVPHAGYIYSGPIAATGYKLLQDLSSSPLKEGGQEMRSLLLGPAHYVYFVGAATLDCDAWQTPLGLIQSARDLIARALECGDLQNNPAAHVPEHSLEVQLPFVQTVLPNCEIFPILTGECDYRELARTLSPYIDDIDLVIVSSDLSHYYPYEEALKRDALAHRAIEHFDFDLMEDRVEACGKTAILTLMRIAKERGWKAKLLNYRNSGDTAGDKFRVVGYGCYAFYEE
ncbi:MAG: AmmeMemoRadiSam system protein B [Candidatus Bipolaricaulota bacterium]|nr:AmmeMemoRadiSam system protein B [Candidatus Bipolaricaulota bacterium]MDW8030577.1 AmmeMemoRadiSam system protein B [Candidatus Bipolaricaulota bacterium]